MTTTAVQPSLFISDKPFFVADFTVEPDAANPDSSRFFVVRRYILEKTDERVEVETFADAMSSVGHLFERLKSSKKEVNQVLYDLTGKNESGDHITLIEWDKLFQRLLELYSGDLFNDLVELEKRKNQLLPVDFVGTVARILDVYMNVVYMDRLDKATQALSLPIGSYHRVYRQELRKASEEM